MSIEFNFTAIPTFFLKTGCLDPKKDGSHLKTLFLLHHLLSRCQSKPHSLYHNQRLIHLQPWEFLCGRKEISEKTGLTENEVRNQLKRWVNQGFVKKSTNGVTNQYTCYIWSTECFCEIDNQRNNQQGNQRVTNAQPQIRSKILRSIDSTPPPTSSKKESSSSFFDCLKEIDIPEHKKIELSEFPEIRVELAVKFTQHENFVPTKSVLDTLFWHCKQKIPPEHSEKPKQQWEVLAHKHNEIYAKHCYPGYMRNKELIAEQKMMIWQIDRFVPISLTNEIAVLKEDFLLADKEFKTAIKNRKEQKTIAIESFA